MEEGKEFKGCGNCANRKKTSCIKGHLMNCFKMTCKGVDWVKKQKMEARMYGTSGIYEQISSSIVSAIVKDMTVVVRTKLKNGGDWFSGTAKGLPSILTIEGKVFKLADISVKGSPDGKPSISIYYHTRHGKDLLRISDHWSERWRLIGSAMAVRGFKGGIKIE